MVRFLKPESRAAVSSSKAKNKATNRGEERSCQWQRERRGASHTARRRIITKEKECSDVKGDELLHIIKSSRPLRQKRRP